MKLIHISLAVLVHRAVGVVTLGVTLWTCTSIWCLALPVPNWISIANGIIALLQNGYIHNLIRTFFKIPNNSWVRHRLAVKGAVALISSWLGVLSLALVMTPNISDCLVEKAWLQAFRSKNDAVIRTVQDQLHCCGFNTIHDRAWPFPSRTSTARSCEQISQFTVPCAPLWKAKVEMVVALNAMASLLNVALVLSTYRFAEHPTPSSQQDPHSLRVVYQEVAQDVIDTFEDEERRRMSR